jgi:hypothetical protein
VRQFEIHLRLYADNSSGAGCEAGNASAGANQFRTCTTVGVGKNTSGAVEK